MESKAFKETKRLMNALDIDTAGMKEIVKVYTPEEWFASEEASLKYACYEHLLREEKHWYENNTYGLENEKYYITDDHTVYRYYEHDGLRFLSAVHVGFMVISNDGWDMASIFFDKALLITKKNWSKEESNRRIFRITKDILFSD